MRKTLLTLFFSLFCISIFAYEENIKIDNIYYQFDDVNNTAKVVPQYHEIGFGGTQDGWMYGNDYSGDVIIPEQVSYNEKTYTVTAIGDCAFATSNIESLYIPKTVTTLENGWASAMNYLYTIECSDENPKYSVYKNVLYEGNTLLVCPRYYDETIYIKEGVTELYGGLNHCDFSYIVLPSTLQVIRDGTFNECSYLMEIEIPDNVTTIGKMAFNNCVSLSEITLGKNLTTVASDAFQNCEELKTVYNNSDLSITAGSSDCGGVALNALWVYNHHIHVYMTYYNLNFNFYSILGELYCIECGKSVNFWGELHYEVVTEPTENTDGEGHFYSQFNDSRIEDYSKYVVIPKGSNTPILPEEYEHIHFYENPDYTYDANTNSVTAQAVCYDYECTSEITETVELTLVTITPATSTTDGLSQWIGVFENPIFETYEGETQIIPSHTHIFDYVKYDINADSTQITAAANCSVCYEKISETVNFNYEIVDIATTEKEGKGRYYGIFTNEYFEDYEDFIILPKLPKEEDDEEISIKESTVKTLIYTHGSSVIIENAIGKKAMIYNIIGNLIYNRPIYNDKETIQLSQNGLYIIKVEDKIQKIIIK